ncbi:Ras family domain-containing protein [Cyclospora cayetanensis]|uniref:Ras family domain-containing protein n=1 Tax=Cyclospora cayetanensis TaxID=88456 RepID=A0A1D3D7W3_9EIME|nr:Ras family domain-containing protein [Cyclospora cayetanensis]
MARNAERANAVLNKWLAVKNAVLKGGQQKALGPCIPEECDDIERATQCAAALHSPFRESCCSVTGGNATPLIPAYWCSIEGISGCRRHVYQSTRSQLVREIGRGISMIQDASLGEHRIRDLNDEINKKLRVKRRWEYRIKELGGADYSTASDALSLSGVAAAGGDYYYFGAAKELPVSACSAIPKMSVLDAGVRELFAAKAEEVNEPRKTRAQLLRRITPDYFGWRDERVSVGVAHPRRIVFELLGSLSRVHQSAFAVSFAEALSEGKTGNARHRGAESCEGPSRIGGLVATAPPTRLHVQPFVCIVHLLKENEDLLLAEQQQEQLWHQEQQEELKQQQELLERVGAASAADVAVGIAAAAERERTTAKHKKDDQQDNNSSSSKKFRVYVDLPTDAEIARLLLEKKKQLIVQKYASVQAQQEEQAAMRVVAGAMEFSAGALHCHVTRNPPLEYPHRSAVLESGTSVDPVDRPPPYG